MVFVWALAGTIVAGYYGLGPVRDGAHHVQEWKAVAGLWFAAAVGFLAGGVLPEVAKLATGQHRFSDPTWLRDLLFRGFVWSGLALMVDTFYVFQARWFGAGND